MLTIDNATKIFQKKQKVNKLTAEIIKLRTALKYWERQKGLAMQQKMGVKFSDKGTC